MQGGDGIVVLLPGQHNACLSSASRQAPTPNAAGCPLVSDADRCMPAIHEFRAVSSPFQPFLPLPADCGQGDESLYAVQSSQLQDMGTRAALQSIQPSEGLQQNVAAGEPEAPARVQSMHTYTNASHFQTVRNAPLASQSANLWQRVGRHARGRPRGLDVMASHDLLCRNARLISCTIMWCCAV